MNAATLPKELNRLNRLNEHKKLLLELSVARLELDLKT
jgi:hypothetical protein